MPAAWIRPSSTAASPSAPNRTIRRQTPTSPSLAKSGKVDEAIPHFEKALAFNPDSIVLQANLGGALMQAGRYSEAIPHFEQAVRLTGGQDPRLLGVLAATYARAERFKRRRGRRPERDRRCPAAKRSQPDQRSRANAKRVRGCGPALNDLGHSL